MNPDVRLQISTEKLSYSADETITLKCEIDNLSPSNIKLVWDQPKIKVWASNEVDIESYGWQNNLVPIEIKAKDSLVKEIRLVQNKNIPYLPKGTHKFNVSFKFIGNENAFLNQTVEVTLTGSISNKVTKNSIIANAKKFSEENYSETIIDYNKGYITDHVPPTDWIVSFSNKGPTDFGVTQIFVDKKTGKAYQPSNPFPLPSN